MSKLTKPLTPDEVLALALENDIPEDRLTKAVGDALLAETINRDGTVTPDHKTRLAAATLAMAYKYGRPLDRQHVLTAKVESEGEADLIARLAHSPAMREALRGVLEAAEGG